MAGINKAKDEYTQRADAVADAVTRNMTTDTSATKKGLGVIANKAAGSPLIQDIGKSVGSIKDVAGLAAAGGLELAQVPTKYIAGEESGTLRGMTDAIYRNLAASESPVAKMIKGGGVGAPTSPAVKTDVAPTAAVKPVEKAAEIEAPVAAAPSVEAPLPAGGTGPWSTEKRNEYLGLNEGKIVKGGGPGGTDLLTNREQPFTQPKELPQEAYGVGGSKEKEAMMADYEKEMRTPYASVDKIKAMERRLGIGNQMTEAQKAANTLERDKMEQSAKQFAKTHDMTQRHNQEQIAMQMGGFTETEVPDPNGTGTIKKRTPNPEFFLEAFDEQGNFNLQNAKKSIEESQTLQNAAVKLRENNNDPSVAKTLKERLMKRGISKDKIKAKLGI